MGNRVFVRENGPLIIKGEVVVIDADGSTLLDDTEAYLCRCGHSKNKPFCDGEHKRNAFSDNAQFVDEKGEALDPGDAIQENSKKLVVTVRENAMLIAKGPMTIQNEAGSSITIRNKAALCRCGLSKNKPFCDASHKTR